MERDQLIIIAGAFIAASYVALRWVNAASDQVDFTQYQDPTQDPSADTPVDVQPTILEDLMSKTNTLLGLWKPPAKYADAIASSEFKYSLPNELLARLLYQESHYRDDIITGKTRSPVGALGIAQFMPATARDMGIDPLDPFQAIDGAGRYLASLYRQTGSWAKALAAYNWGVGNVQRRGLANAPTETRNYYTQILADVNNSNGSTLA